ncbi:MAG: ROK family protein [Acidimicrobiia bacterium]|nr:ROK family protein [Acidimicrobiia bacterium]
MAGALRGSIEAGGTKWICAVGTGLDDLASETRIDTTSPSETLGRVIDFFRNQPAIDSLGVASFGPLELRSDRANFGSITATPKPGWSNTDLAGTLGGALGVPVGIDTDVNGAALGEGRWGSAVGLTSFVYLTVGTGIGAGVLVDGRPLHGLVHPEIGHVAVNRHPDDGFAGLCPFHGDCFEGLASGPAISERWGDEPRQLAPALARSAAQMEAFYVAEGLRTIVFTLAPERIIVGGGVSQIDGFHQDVRSALMKTLAGYPGLSEHESEDFVVAPGLGDRSGIAGGFVLADLALAAS